VKTPLLERLKGSGPATIPLLRVVAGPDVLRFAVIDREEALEVGRDPECALSLSDASVSRRHARIERTAGGFFLEDLGSRNGTRVNGEARAGKIQLEAGDRLEVGTVLLRFELVSLPELAHLRGVLARLAASDRDPLTGLKTRKFLDEKLPALLERGARKARPTSAVFVDLDRFKRINDRFGHAIGDDVLRQVARLVLFALRGREVCVRYGGEELLVILEGSPEATAVTIAERLRQQIEAHDWGRLADGLAVTISCGVAEHEPGEPVRPWLERADAALYAAKRGGRNRVLAASTPRGKARGSK
jgi:diguanylate cyclase (GGDEF)-like protein